MRIGTASYYRNQSDRMSTLQSQINDLQSQISFGKKILKPADDPVGSNRLALLTAKSADNIQFKRNLDVAVRRLSLADTATNSMTDQIVRAREIAVSAGNPGYSAEDRQGFAAEIATIDSEIFSLVNTRDIDGSYVFSGTSISQPAFARDPQGAAVWQGADQPLQVQANNDTLITSGDTGLNLLTSGDDTKRQTVFAMLADFQEILTRQVSTDTDRATWQADLKGILQSFDSAITQLTTSRATFGTRLAQADSERDMIDTHDLTIETEKSALESLDMASAITSLQSTLQILQATQQSFSRISGLSLFDALR